MRLLAHSWLYWLVMVMVVGVPAQAEEFNRILPAQSRIAFVSTQMGTEVVGRFQTFRADLAFDPARPAGARVRIEIDTASVDAGSKAGNDAVKGAAWLDVAAYPRAQFESTSVRALGRGRYEALGRMTLHGQSREAKIRFSFRQVDGRGVFAGRFNLRRLNYGIGEAVWGDTGVVSDVVRIEFSLVADSAAMAPNPARGMTRQRGD